MSARIPELLRTRPFRRYWAAQSISVVGDEIAAIGMPLTAILVIGADAADMGGLTAARLLPALLLSIAVGAWADRQPRRRRLMIAADLGRFAAVASVPVVYLTGALSLGQLYITAFVVGALGVLFNVCNSTIYVALVPPSRYVQASSLLNGSRSMAFVAGPSVGGILVQILTAPFALIANALGYLASALFLSRISPNEPPPAKRAKGHLTAGLSWIAQTAVMRSLLAAVATLNFFNFMFQALFVLYATTVLGVGPGVLGVVIGIGALGGVVGALIAGRVVSRLGIGRAIACGFVGFSLPLVLVPLVHGPQTLILAGLLFAEFASCLGVMILDISSNALQTALIEDRLRARVSGVLQTVNFGIRPAGAIAGGLLATATSERAALWVATVGAALSVFWLLPSPLLRMRDVPGATRSHIESSRDDPDASTSPVPIGEAGTR